MMYKLFCTFRTVFLGFLIFAVLPSPAFSASALFTVEDVRVDVTAENALKAREQAFEEAQSIAFNKLIQRMLTEEEMRLYHAPDPESLSTMIQDFEITKEKISPVRYIGTYTFRFKDLAVRQFFANQGLSFSDVASKPVLVLPFYQVGDKTHLWSPYNLWKRAWDRAMELESGLVPVKVPMGDVTDISYISDSDALAYSEKKLLKMLRRYDAGEAVLVMAAPEGPLAHVSDGKEKASGVLTVYIYRTDRRGPEFVQGIKIEANGYETVNQLMNRAVDAVQKTLQRNWKDQTVVASDRDSSLLVRVRFEGLKQWAETQKALRSVYGLNDMRIISMTPKQARIELIYQGSERRLRLALKQADLTLTAPRINADVIARARYRDRAFTRNATPLEYDLYLNKYAPQNGFQPVYNRRGHNAQPSEPGADANGNPDSRKPYTYRQAY